LLIVTSPKGGVGKTTAAIHLAVAAALDNLSVVTADLDAQATLTRWWNQRNETQQNPVFPHVQVSWDDVPDLAAKELDCDLVVVDTPTSVEERMDQIKPLLICADYIIVPVRENFFDIESAIPWMQQIQGYGKPATFFLNQVRKGTKQFERGKKRLNMIANLCPIEMPGYTQVASVAEFGLSILDVKNGKGADDFHGVWKFVKRGLEL
jgi:chromosome partitioning protein